ncbi:NAD-dependent epimerase/dehydratase family protein [bacterium]|nr:NAD-dependent epimerase/dehydratase family protein [candidate division CSSED10-310 bacterium]
MKVLVIGGTRFIGMFAVQALLELGCRITMINRSGPKVFDGRVTWIQGNRNDERVMMDVLRHTRPDVVLDMIPVTESQAELLVRACAKQSPRIVSISSMDVYKAFGIILGIESHDGHLQPVPLREDAPLRSRLFPYREPTPRSPDDPQRIMDDYDKIPVEDRVMNSQSIRGTVVRLPFVYGPFDTQHRMWEYLKRMMDRRPYILIDEVMAGWRSSRGYAANMGYGIAQAVTDERAADAIFNLADEPTMSILEWVRAIATAVGWKGTILTTGPETTPPHLRVSMNAAQHLIGDTGKIRSMLAYSERVEHTEGILRTVEWESAHPPELSPEQIEAVFDYDAEDRVITV